jgi:hypothetical protein
MITIHRRIALGATLALAAACDSSSPSEPNLEPLPEPNLQWADVGMACVEDAPAVPLTPEQRAALPVPSFMNADDRLAAESRDVPGGWGGFFYRDGVATAYLVDPSKLTEATAAMTGSLFMPRAPDVALKGRWTFAELRDWKLHLSVHGAMVGATVVDAQETRNRLEIGVPEEASRSAFEARLKDIGAPCWLVAIYIAPPIQAATH